VTGIDKAKKPDEEAANAPVAAFQPGKEKAPPAAEAAARA
jgi:hypothetical protein